MAATAVFFIAAAGLLPAPAAAFGALAVGEPSDTARDGIALGWSYDIPNNDEAIEEALAVCREAPAPRSTRALCKLITTFEKECVALSIDPRPGRKGFGWAINAKRPDAESAALQKCRASGGARCEVRSDCD